MQPGAGGGGNGAGGAGGAQQGGGMFSLGGIVKMVMIYFLINSFFGGNKQATVDPNTGQKLPPMGNMWSPGARMELRVYQSFEDEFDYDDLGNQELLLWEEKNLRYDWSESNYRHKRIVIPATSYLQNNGSLYAHAFLTVQGYSADPRHEKYDERFTIHHVNRLNAYMLEPKKNTRTNLLSNKPKEATPTPAPVEVQEERKIVSYWKPNMTLSLVHDFARYSQGSIPPQMSQRMQFYDNNYYPVLFFNEFWMLKESYYLVNETVTELPLDMSFEILSMLKWQFIFQMEESFSMQKNFGAEENDSEEVKRMFLDTNPYLLGVTMVVSILHMVFDFLAFKNDISFWKNNRSMAGLSVRTVFFNTFCQVVIFLYLVDNETSYMILVSSGIGLLIEFWKITKCVDIQWSRDNRFNIPWPKLEDKDTYSSKTKEYDVYATKYLSYLLYALVIGYSIYSLIYEEHKSWYSWILGSLVGTVYTFGFVMMTPQLFINYKLKSVAHLPWKTLIYKALNTFIDDLFAFIIKMPTLHRVACFRDDIIFFIYIYQRWIYPVDKKRISDGFEEADIDGDVTLPNAIVDADNAAAPSTTASKAIVATTSSGATSSSSSGTPKGGKGKGDTKKQR